MVIFGKLAFSTVYLRSFEKKCGYAKARKGLSVAHDQSYT